MSQKIKPEVQQLLSQVHENDEKTVFSMHEANIPPNTDTVIAPFCLQ